MKNDRNIIFLFLGAAALMLYKANKDKAEAKKINSVLFIGDSITAIKDYSNNKPIVWTYPTPLKALLLENKKSIIVDVLAKGGEQTKWMLENFTTKAQSNFYDRVYIYGGINDAFSNKKPEDIIKNINQIIDIAIKKGMQVYIIQGYKPLPFMDYKKMPTTRYVTKKEDYKPLIANYIEYQKKLAELQQVRKDFTLIPYIDLQELTSDGIHPNFTAAKIIASEIYKTL